jgi:hypothetical protein
MAGRLQASISRKRQARDQFDLWLLAGAVDAAPADSNNKDNCAPAVIDNGMSKW